MSQPAALRASAASTQTSTAAENHLSGRWLLLARSLWLVLAADLLANFIASIPASYAQWQMICATTVAQCTNSFQLLPDNVQALHHLGLSVATYAAAFLSVDVAVSLVYLAVGGLIFWRKSQERWGLIFSFALILYGAFGIAGTLQFAFVHVSEAPSIALVLVLFFLLPCLQWGILGGFLLPFPSGRFAPRWSRVIVLAWVIQVLLFSFSVVVSIPRVVPSSVLLLTFGSTMAVQAYRYRRLYTPAQRQQTKWVVVGILTGLLIKGLSSALGDLVPGLGAPESPYQLLSGFFAALLLLPIPLSIGIAILRSQLWDIDTIINKALVYGSLTGLLGALYAGLIIGLESLAGLFTKQTTDPVVLVISTLAIAALFLPVRRHLQNLIDRRFYRRKYDAEKTLAAFSATLRQETDLEQIRTRLLAVVQETMQPAHVSLWLRPPEQRTEEQPHRLELHTQGLTLEQWEKSGNG